MSTENVRVQILDLGMHVGGVTHMFTEALRQCAVSNWVIHGFEPHRDLYQQCLRRFQECDGVHVHQLAISNRQGQIKLHLSNDAPGHSIFPDKRNVDKDRFDLVPTVRLSQWLRDNLQLPGAINVLKMNIEGAEWEVYEDLVSNGLHGQFDLYLGTPGHADDIHKISSMKHKYHEYRQFLKSHSIHVERFSDNQFELNYPFETWLLEAVKVKQSGS